MSKPIQSVERAMRMLEFLAREQGAAPLGAIARAAGVQSSTAHNILATLVALGYVRRPATGSEYRLGGRILNLARIAGDDDALRRRFRPLIEETAQRFNESTYLIVPSGGELLSRRDRITEQSRHLQPLELPRAAVRLGDRPRARCVHARRRAIIGRDGRGSGFERRASSGAPTRLRH